MEKINKSKVFFSWEIPWELINYLYCLKTHFVLGPLPATRPSKLETQPCLDNKDNSFERKNTNINLNIKIKGNSNEIYLSSKI